MSKKSEEARLAGMIEIVVDTVKTVQFLAERRDEVSHNANSSLVLEVVISKKPRKIALA